jgi:transposase
MKTYKRRKATLILNNKLPQFQELILERSICKDCHQEVFNKTVQFIKDKQIERRFFGSFCDFVIVKDSNLYKELEEYITVKQEKDKLGNVIGDLYTVTTSTLVKTVFKDIFDSKNFQEKGIANYKRSIVKHALDRIDGFLERNKKKIATAQKQALIEANAIKKGKKVEVALDSDKKKKKLDPNKLPIVHFKGETLHISEGMNYDYETKILTIPISSGKIEIPVYKYISKGVLSKNFGGNFIFRYDKKRKIRAIVLQAAVQIVQDVDYEPDGFIGFDINQTVANWVTFDDGEKIARPEDMTEKIKRNNTLNRQISNGDKQAKVVLDDGSVRVIRSKERSRKRDEQTTVLKDIQKLTKKHADYIINKALSQNKGIAIDKITPGAAGNGEFGQYIANYVQTVCEDQKIPFYIIPSAYTSMKCSNCGHIEKKNRDKDDFKCISCEYEEESHINAANNIKNSAEQLYALGIMYSGLNAFSVDKLIEKTEKLEKSLQAKGFLEQEEFV